MMLSVVIPVYGNAATLPELLAALEELSRRCGVLEAVFVVDGSPDDSYLELATRLPGASFPAQLISLSRNFGSFAAVRAGLEAARGECFAVMAADLQEPIELLAELYRALQSGAYDLAVGERTGRADPFLTSLLARTYWRLYRRFVQPDLPPGGVDVFACRRAVRDQILQLRESNSSLVGLLFWVGFRRTTVPYVRRRRPAGRSSWTLRKRLRYLADSVFGFTDLPIRLLLYAGVAGLVVSVLFGLAVLTAKAVGGVSVPGYAATVITVIFFGGLNSLGLGIIGGYVWRTFENSKQRPGFIVASRQVYAGGAGTTAGEEAC